MSENISKLADQKLKDTQKYKKHEFQFPLRTRLRRNRTDGWLRDMVRENEITPSDLIWPLFVIEGEAQSEEIDTLPGVVRHTSDRIVAEAKRAAGFGIPAIALFPITPDEKKDVTGSEAHNKDNLICRTLRALKDEVPEIGVITDVALDPYTSHGHDGILENGKILNDESVEVLCHQALVQAEAGADIIAPSDMMDGRIGAIRDALDENGFEDVKIMSYAAKYASCFYGPFRDAVKSGGCLQGDKKTYQMDPANAKEALREVALDIEEGADMVMIKPGLPYLDIIHRVKATFEMPTMAYHVSGEYAMLAFAAKAGALNFDQALAEVILSFKRAGADAILTYGSMALVEAMDKKKASI